jgi:hypothetical protein
VTVRLQFAQYLLSVYGAAAPGTNTSYTLLARFTDDAATAPPVPGGGGALDPKVITSGEVRMPGDAMAMAVRFNTSSDADALAGRYFYRVYYASSPAVAAADLPSYALTNPCATDAASLGSVDATTGQPLSPAYADADACVVDSPCGVLAHMAPGTEWLALPAGAAASIAVDGLVQGIDVTFSVLVLNNATGEVAAYTAARGVPTYTKVEQAQSNAAIAGLVGGAAGFFALLLGSAFLVRHHVSKRIEASVGKYVPIRVDAEAAAAAAAAGRMGPGGGDSSRPSLSSGRTVTAATRRAGTTTGSSNSGGGGVGLS